MEKRAGWPYYQFTTQRGEGEELHVIFKIAAILFGIVWVVGVGLEVLQNFQLFGPMATGGEVLLDPLGEPWRSWFKDQTNMILAPLITLFILWLFSYLAKPNKK